MHASSPNLFFSVIVPTINRPQLLDRCLNALFSQTLPPNRFEVIVVDDGASDREHNDTPTWRAVSSWQRRIGPPIRYVPAFASEGPAAARNLGALAARADLLAFTDDDCVPDSRWLENAYDSLRFSALDAAWGTIEVPLDSRPSDYEKTTAMLGEAGFSTADCFCKREVFFQIGGFDERYRTAWREDSDLFFSLLKHKKKVSPIPDAKVLHPVRPGFFGISIFQESKCFYDALLYKKYPEFYGRWLKPGRPWLYYWIAACVVVALVSAASGHSLMARAGLAGWLLLTLYLIVKRMRGTKRTPAHLLEVTVTSIMVPPVSLFWRLLGGFKYNVVFI